jgi:hypothetical protein
MIDEARHWINLGRWDVVMKSASLAKLIDREPRMDRLLMDSGLSEVDDEVEAEVQRAISERR